MLPIGEIPEDIRQALEGYEKFFARKEQFESFLLYLTGLIVSHKGNIAAIADLFWEGLEKDQSNLNRFVTESAWDVEGIAHEPDGSPRRMKIVLVVVLVLVVGCFGMRTTDQRPSTRTRTRTIFGGVEAERLRRFKEHPVLKPGKAGGIGIDDVLLAKSGEQMAGVGVLKDHSSGEYVLAHCLVTSSYDKGNWCYPLYHAPYFKEAVCPQEGWEFKSKVT